MANPPLGYETPKFPSVSWPKHGNSDFRYLYYTKDIWIFTMTWSVIFMVGVYSCAGSIAIFSHYRSIKYDEELDSRKPKSTTTHQIPKSKLKSLKNNYIAYLSRHKNLLFIALTYIAMGAIQAFVSGSLVGLLISAIYRSGEFKMNTWIPLVYAIIIVLYNVLTSYSLTSPIL